MRDAGLASSFLAVGQGLGDIIPDVLFGVFLVHGQPADALRVGRPVQGVNLQAAVFQDSTRT